MFVTSLLLCGRLRMWSARYFPQDLARAGASSRGVLRPSRYIPAAVLDSGTIGACAFADGAGVVRLFCTPLISTLSQKPG